MSIKNWVKYDIVLFILWTIVFVIGFFNGVSLLSYVLMYLGLVCELLKYIVQFYCINRIKKNHNCNHLCGESCNCFKEGKK